MGKGSHREGRSRNASRQSQRSLGGSRDFDPVFNELDGRHFAV